MLSKFDKAREQTANDLGIAKYDKDDFFDTMSSDTTQKENRSARAAEVRFSDLDVDPVGTLRATYAALGWAEAFEKVEPAIERYKLSLVDFKKNAFGKRALSSEAEAAVRYRWRAWFEDLGYE